MHRMLTIAAPLYALWLIWILPSWPCLLDWDTVTQIFQFATPAPLDYYHILLNAADVQTKFIDHKPLFTTLVYGSVWQIGVWVGNQQLVFGIYSIAQSMLTALEIAACILFAEKFGAPAGARWGAVIFTGLFPAFPRYAFAMVSDTLFALAFIPYLLLFLEAFWTKGHALKSRRFVIALSLTGLACLLTKKTGAFVVVPSGIVLAIVFRAQWKAIALAVSAPLAISAAIVPLVVFPLLDVAPGGRQEALGPFFQQAVTVLAHHGNDLSEEERSSVEKMFVVSDIEDRLNPRLTDSVKKWHDPAASTEDLLAFARTYLSWGLRYPDDYLYALFRPSIELILPASAIDLPWSSLDFTVDEMKEYEGDADIQLARPSAAVAVSTGMDRLYQAVSESAVWPLFAKGTYGGVLPLVCFALLVLARRFAGESQKSAPISPLTLTPAMLSCAVLVLSPTDAARYLLPLLFAAPLLVCLAVQALQTILARKATSKATAERSIIQPTATSADQPYDLRALP